jgi:hypothetical protein
MILTIKKIVLFLILFLSIFVFLTYYNTLRENFDAPGQFLTGTPNWFVKPDYDIKKWFVNAYPDRIQPSCLPYSVTNKYNGDLGLLNFYSSTNQYWRF